MTKIAILFFLIFPLMLTAHVEKTKSEDQSYFLAAQVMIGGKTGGEIIREDFFDSKGLEVISNDSSTYTLTKFKLSIVKKGADLISFWNKTSGSLTPEMISALQDMQTGGTVFFEFMTAKNQRGESFPLKPFELKVK